MFYPSVLYLVSVGAPFTPGIELPSLIVLNNYAENPVPWCGNLSRHRRSTLRKQLHRLETAVGLEFYLVLVQAVVTEGSQNGRVTVCPASVLNVGNTIDTEVQD